MHNDSIKATKKEEERSKTALKNATSNIFFNNQTHHKQTDDFKENNAKKTIFDGFIPPQIKNNSPLTNEYGYNQGNHDELLKYNQFSGFDMSSKSMKTPSQVNLQGISFYSDNMINLEEIKYLLKNKFDMMTLLFSKLLSFLIPQRPESKRKTVDLVDSVAKYHSRIRGKENKSQEFLNLVRTRLDMLFNYNIFMLSNCFSGEIRQLVASFLNLEVKFFVSCWIIFDMSEESTLCGKISDIVNEFHQLYLAITHWLLLKIEHTHSSNPMYQAVKVIVDERIFSFPVKNREIQLLSTKIDLIQNMTRVFILNYISDKDKACIEESKIANMKNTYLESNKSYFVNKLLGIVKNLNNHSDLYARELYTSMKSDELKGISYFQQEVYYKPRAPYIPALKNPDNIYTLVLDLDETLIHYRGKVSSLFKYKNRKLCIVLNR